MGWQFSIYSILTIVFSGISVLVAILIWQRRQVYGSLPLFFLLLGVAFWSISAGLEAALVGVSIPTKTMFSKISYFGIATTPVLLLMFSLEFVNQEKLLFKRKMLPLWIIPAISIIMAFTNDEHYLLWSSYSISPIPGSTFLVYNHGPWFWVHVAYSYLMLLTSTIYILLATLRMRHIYRRQLLVVLASMPLPWLGNIMYVFSLTNNPGEDYTPLGFGLTAIIIAFGLFRLRLFDLVPVARERMVEWMDDGLIVLDNQGRIIDLNEAARKLLGSLPGTILNTFNSQFIGMQFDQVFHAWSDLITRVNSKKQGSFEIMLPLECGLRSFQLRILLITQSSRSDEGMMVILHEITALKQARDEAIRGRELAEVLLATGTALNSTLYFDQVLNLIFDQIKRVLEFDYCAFELVEDSDIVIAGIRGFEDPQTMLGQRFSMENRPNLDVVKHQKPVLLNRVTGESRVFLHDYAPDIHSYLAVPIVFQNQVMAILALYCFENDRFTVEDEWVVTIFANQAAISMENSRLYEETKKLAVTDTLTGVNNRRQFFILAGIEFERSVRYHKMLSAIMVDVDDFKQINDTFGHKIGDAVLQGVGKTLSKALRRIDILGRYGGDEFVILLPETSDQGAQQTAARLSQVIKDSPILTRSGSIDVSISLGVSSLTDESDTLEMLIDRADMAMYKEKKVHRCNPGVDGQSAG